MVSRLRRSLTPPRNHPVSAPDPLPRAGDVLLLNRDASAQFANPITVRVVRVHDWSTYEGWCWLDCYQLDRAGNAVARRSLFVLIAGLRPSRDPLRTGPPPLPRRRPQVPPGPECPPGASRWANDPYTMERLVNGLHRRNV